MSLKGYKFILARGEGSINSTTPLLDVELIEVEKPQEKVVIPEETDPTVPSHVKDISVSDIDEWNTAFNKIVTGINISGTDTKTINIIFSDGTSVSGNFPDLQGTGGVEVESDPKGLAGLAVTGTGTKTITATLNDGSIISTQFSDKDTIYTHPAKAWSDKTNLSGATVISNITIDSTGHATGWTTRTITPANIGAEPAFSKNNAFNKTFGIANGDVFNAGLYGDFEIINFPSGVTNYTINHNTKYPRLYTTHGGEIRNLYVGAETQASDYFYIRNTYVDTVHPDNNIPIALVDSTDCLWVIPMGFKNKIKAGGTVLVTQGVFIGVPAVKMWHVTGDLVEDNVSTYTPRRGTVIITSNTTLTTALHDQKTLLCRNSGADITITIPTGLGEDFDCAFISEDSGTRYTQIVAGTGVTLKAPHGAKLLTDYPAHLMKRTGSEIFNLQGELTP